jgi:hypothetical protein
MSSFRHLDGMRHLLEELYEVNERIMVGDICSAKTALTSGRLKKMLTHYADALGEDGATNVSLQFYAAAGGWIGVTYSYEIDGCQFAGSQVPRRV